MDAELKKQIEESIRYLHMHTDCLPQMNWVLQTLLKLKELVEQSEKDEKQLASLILKDSDGGTMNISSCLTHDLDGTMRFTVTNPKTARRFGVYLGLAELKPDTAMEQTK